MIFGAWKSCDNKFYLKKIKLSAFEMAYSPFNLHLPHICSSIQLCICPECPIQILNKCKFNWKLKKINWQFFVKKIDTLKFIDTFPCVKLRFFFGKAVVWLERFTPFSRRLYRICSVKKAANYVENNVNVDAAHFLCCLALALSPSYSVFWLFYLMFLLFYSTSVIN